MANGWGGARPGAGRKPRDYEAPETKIDLDREKARNEKAKADLNELELKIKTGEYVPRAQVRQATATALATLAQTLRSVPDNLERKLGISPEIATEIGLQIDNALAEVANAFEETHTLAGQREDFGEPDYEPDEEDNSDLL
jgi:phage terminase Nu1 subunit (DNA packaging protein)